MASRIKNILLIYPPTVSEKLFYTKMVSLPLGLAYIASVLKDEFNVSALDASVEGYVHETTLPQDRDFFQFGLEHNEIKKRIEAAAPDFVGISCLLSVQYPSVLKICRDVKNIDRSIMVAIGGPHPSFAARAILEKNQDVDFVVIGEGEYTVRDLLRSLNKGESLSGLDGLAYRDNGSVYVNPKRKFIEYLDDLPFPSRELFLMEKYNAHPPFWAIPRKGQNYASLVTSRGCPTRCSFCQSSVYWGVRYRQRSVENVLAEMEYLQARHKVTNFHFVDDNLTLDRQRAKTLFQEFIRRDWRISWCAPNGVCLWTLDEELIDLMKQSGCYELNFGIESGSPEVLRKIVKKPLDLEKAQRMIKRIKQNKMHTCGFFNLGFPGEKIEDIQATLELAKRLNLDRSIFFTPTPFAGTALYETCRKEGYITADYDESYNELFSPKFENEQFKKKELDKIIILAYGYHIFRYFLRHPMKCLEVWGPFLRYTFLHLLGLKR